MNFLFICFSLGKLPNGEEVPCEVHKKEMLQKITGENDQQCLNEDETENTEYT